MNPEHLLKHFDLIAEAPDAIPRLRRFILDLAVRGKLVEQDSEDGSVVEQLKIYERKREEIDFIPLFSEDDTLAFKIPSTWEWAYLGRIAFVEMGQSPPSEYYNQSGEGMPFYQGKADFGLRNPTPRFWCRQPTKIAKRNDILISIRAPVGPTNVVSEDSCIGRGLAAIRPYPVINLELLLYWLKGFEKQIATMGFGTTFIAINKKQLLSFPLPIPPLAEQHRIVAKVDELMALCDELAAAKTKRERRRDRLVAATLHGINNGEACPEPGAHSSFNESARFYFNHFPRLTTRPEHIQQLRQTILNLAVRGKLVPQDPNDEPASVPVDRIQTEKQRLMRAGEIRQGKVAPSISVNEISFVVPNTWEWTRLIELVTEVTSGSRGWAEFYSSSGAMFIRAQNIKCGRLELKDIAHVELPSSVEGKRTSVQQGDLLIVITGAGVTNTGMVEEDIGEAYVSQHVALLHPVESSTSRWLLLCLQATAACRGELTDKAYGSGKPGLNLDNIRMLKVPFPSLAEQNRIVTKVDELMAICDELEAGLEATTTTQRQFLEASLLESLQ